MENQAEESAWQNVQTLLEMIDDSDIDENEKTRIVGAHSKEEIGSALRTAVRIRNIDTTKFLLEQGVSPNETDEQSSPLAIACSNTDVPMVKLLLSFGADPFLEYGEESPISFALLKFVLKREDSEEEPCKEILRLFLDTDDFANESERNRPLALLAAVASGYYDKAKRILLSGKCVLGYVTVRDNGCTKVGVNAMAEACKNRDREMMKLLYIHEADPFEYPYGYKDHTRSEVDCYFDSAAGTAIMRSDCDMVEAILDLEPEGEKKDEYRSMMFTLSLLRREVEIIEKLLLHTHGWNINMAFPDKDTPLQVAVYLNRPDICCWLLENGADVNLSTGKSFTPLMAACSGGYSDIVLCLLEGGALTNAVDDEGYAAIHYACCSEELDEVYSTIRHLLNFGANLQIKSRSGFMEREPIEYPIDNPVVERGMEPIEHLIVNPVVKGTMWHAQWHGSGAILVGYVDTLCLLLGTGAKVHIDSILINEDDYVDSHDDLVSLFSSFLCNETEQLPPNFTKLVKTVVKTENLFFKEIGDLLVSLNIEANASIQHSAIPELRKSIAFLQEYLSNAQSLKELCRQKVRQAIRPPLWATVHSLKEFEFPTLLKKYLLFEF